MIRLMDTFESPLLGERKRAIRKIMNPTTSKGTNTAIRALILLLYLVLAVYGLSVDNSALLAVISFALLTALCFLTPALLHSAIAGEREKRTWDFLAVAPLTASQIILGKFSAGMSAVLMLMLACSPFFLMSTFRPVDPEMSLSYPTTFVTQPQYVLYIALTILTFSMALAAFSILISSRSRRAFTAQGVILGLEALVLLIFPTFLSAISTDRIYVRLLTALSPYSSVSGSLDRAVEGSDFYGVGSDALPMLIPPLIPCATYLIFTVLCLIWSERTIRFADNDVRFVKARARNS
ncbi:MAG TPA: ABC transporter permease subunit [Fimbriimonadaceae bacterium]|nr:ABC transporter permease subunit [Fimbriimonadaceae bacterium]HRJ33608.1 ABC transporter permease subunit [Fimbriimonadaceae bacterium]